MSYAVFKNYGYTTEFLVGEYESYSKAQNVAEVEAEFSSPDDLIEVSSFSDDGEYVVHWYSYGTDEEDYLFDEYDNDNSFDDDYDFDDYNDFADHF